MTLELQPGSDICCEFNAPLFFGGASILWHITVCPNKPRRRHQGNSRFIATLGFPWWIWSFPSRCQMVKMPVACRSRSFNEKSRWKTFEVEEFLSRESWGGGGGLLDLFLLLFFVLPSVLSWFRSVPADIDFWKLSKDIECCSFSRQTCLAKGFIWMALGLLCL